MRRRPRVPVISSRSLGSKRLRIEVVSLLVILAMLEFNSGGN